MCLMYYTLNTNMHLISLYAFISVIYTAYLSAYMDAILRYTDTLTFADEKQSAKQELIPRAMLVRFLIVGT